MVEASADGLMACIRRAVEMYRNNKDTWLQIQKTGMSQNLSWDKSAQEYLAVYEGLV
jgi:starch synthase